jgi:SAM-dependent methyltransferase
MDTIEIQRLVAVEDGNWWYRERRAIVAAELRRLGEPGQAVDIGAAAGGNTRVLIDHGWAATAVDRSNTAVELSCLRGVPTIHGDARCLPLPSDEFDFALAMDVLEHIEDDRLAAAELARVLRPAGTALVSVSCDMALWSTHDVVLGHVRRYSRRTLTECLESAGLVVDRIWSWNVLLRPALRWRRRHAVGHATTPQPKLINTALRATLALERHLPVKNLPSETLFAHCHKITPL